MAESFGYRHYFWKRVFALLLRLINSSFANSSSLIVSACDRALHHLKESQNKQTSLSRYTSIYGKFQCLWINNVLSIVYMMSHNDFAEL